MTKETKDIITAADVTDAIKKAWKEKYGEGKVSVIKVEGKVGYLRPPTRTEMGAYSVTYRTNPVKANESLFKTVWLGGDREIIDDDRLFYGACDKLPELVEAAESELEKL
jgi:hypothetical protein